MNFGEALEAVKSGKRIARRGWNGKNMFVLLVPGSEILVDGGRPLGKAFPEYADTHKTLNYRSHLDMYTAQGDVVPWVATQTDLLGEDWEVVS